MREHTIFALGTISAAAWRARTSGRALTQLAVTAALSGVVSCGDKPTVAGEIQPRPGHQLLLRVSGDSQAQVVAHALRRSLEVRVVRADGTPIRGDSVVFSTVNGGSFAGGGAGRVASDENGLASVVWLLGPKAGEQLARVTLAGGGLVAPAVIFRATALADDPTVLELLVPDSLAVPPAPRMTLPLSAQVRDRHGNAVAEVVVRWLRPTFGRVDPDSSLSDHDGKVFTQWTIEPLVQDSASVVDYSVTVHIDDARAGEVVPRTIHRRVGIQTPNGSLEGVWIAERWEFFSDDAMTRLIEDVIGHGMSGTLTIAATASGVFDWSWRERYAWWGPDNGTDSYGQFEVNGLTIDARLTGVSSRLECDWGDCDGPLHGRYSWFFDGSRLVITRSNSVDYYRVVGPLRAWSRLTLSRR